MYVIDVYGGLLSKKFEMSWFKKLYKLSLYESSSSPLVDFFHLFFGPIYFSDELK